jgi:hypothetical protein
MKIGRGNRSTRRKPAPAPLCPPQIPLDQTRARTRAAALGPNEMLGVFITDLNIRQNRSSEVTKIKITAI